MVMLDKIYPCWPYFENNAKQNKTKVCINEEVEHVLSIIIGREERHVSRVNPQNTAYEMVSYNISYVSSENIYKASMFHCRNKTLLLH